MSRLENFVGDQELQDCLLKIEQKLGWGMSKTWSSYDFEKLSEDIHQVTDMKLSANTLKRVWGRLSYDSKPSTTTLNILAQYLGFDDWRSFKTRISDKGSIPVPSWSKKYYLIAVALLVAVPLIGVLLSGSSFLSKKIVPEDFSFSNKVISDGIPNSVVFEYKVPQYIDDKDVLEIQQNWDDSKRILISNTDSIATSIYFSPGYFQAKLVVNDQIVKEQDLLIPSNGWLGILEGAGQPIYLVEEDILINNKIEVSSNKLTERIPTIASSDVTSKLYYIKNFEDLYLDDLNIDIVLAASELDSQRGACKISDITIYCEGQVIIIPLTDKGCISNLNLLILDEYYSGKTNDLSGFGVDMNEDIRINLTSSDGKLSIFINNVLAYSVQLEKEKPSSISGIRFQFQGSGGINKIDIKNKEKVYLSY